MVLPGVLEVKNKAISWKIYGSEGRRSAPEVKASPNRNKNIPNRNVSSQVEGEVWTLLPPVIIKQ